MPLHQQYVMSDIVCTYTFISCSVIYSDLFLTIPMILPKGVNMGIAVTCAYTPLTWQNLLPGSYKNQTIPLTLGSLLGSSYRFALCGAVPTASYQCHYYIHIIRTFDLWTGVSQLAWELPGIQNSLMGFVVICKPVYRCFGFKGLCYIIMTNGMKCNLL